MQLSATLLAILAVLALTQAAPAPSPAPAPAPVVDRLSIVASNRARFSAAAAASYASVAAVASSASASAASAASRASVASARSVIVASNRARLSAHAATATATPSGFATLPASVRSSMPTAAPSTSTQLSYAKSPATTGTGGWFQVQWPQLAYCQIVMGTPLEQPGYCDDVASRFHLTLTTRSVAWPTASAA